MLVPVLACKGGLIGERESGVGLKILVSLQTIPVRLQNISANKYC
jgi:hypothetical protein